MTKLLQLLGLLALMYLALCVLLYVAQRRMLYFPTPALDAPDAQPMRVRSGDVELRVWKIPGRGPDALLYFGGNAEAVQFNVADFRRELPEHSVYLVCYRGYCGSAGSPSQPALYADALAVFDAVQPAHRRIAVLGRSLGSAVAVHLATQRPVERLILVTPFDSLRNVAAQYYPLFPVRWLMKDPYDAQARASALRMPVLALLAEHDEVIPRPHSLRLIAALDPRQTHARTLPGTGHNTVEQSARYYPEIRDFLSSKFAADDPEG